MNNLDYTIQGNEIFFKNGQSAIFDFPIIKNEIVQVDSVIIIILDVPSKTKYYNNVFAYDILGNYLWQISFDEDQLFYKGKDCFFVGALIKNRGQLVLFNWCDTAFIVDPYTGEILDKYITK